jgi:ATP-binding cassette subfamily C protein
MLKEVDRALAVALAVSGVMAVLLLAVPLQALAALEAALPGGTFESLLLITLVAAAAVLALTGLEVVRDRILRRSALWIAHTLGQHMLADGLARDRAAGDIAADARALTTVERVLPGPLTKSLLDLVWLPLPVAAVACVEPRLGLIVAAALAMVAVIVVADACLTAASRAEAARARAEAELWRQSQTVSADTDAVEAAGTWELLHRGHVAAAYRAGRQSMLPVALARMCVRSAEIGIWAVGAWLVTTNALTPVALVVAGLIVHRTLAPVETLLAALDELAELRAAYARLAAMPLDQPLRQPASILPAHGTHSDARASTVRLIAVGGRTLVERAA